MSYQRLIESRLPPQGRSGNNFIYKCPKCTDTSGHLYVDYDKNKFHCFRCGYAGRDVSSLAHTLGLSVDVDFDSLSRDSYQYLSETLSSLSTKKRVIEVDYSRNLHYLTEFYYYHLKPLSSVARSYLHLRGLTDDLINRYQISEGIDRRGTVFTLDNKEEQGRDYSGRIMVPSLYRDGISFYVARDYTGFKRNKYMNPPQTLAYASEDVWNLDRVDSNSVIICEGVFTAITAGGTKCNAVATYGKSLAKSSNSDNPMISVRGQGDKLLRRKFDTYYIAYDADAQQETLRTCEWLRERGCNVRVIKIDPKIYGEKADINSIGYDEFIKLLSKSIVYNSKLDLLGYGSHT